MANNSLKSEYEKPPPSAEKTLPEYYLAKAKHYANLGREVWLEDAFTGEKRYFSKLDEETKKIASALYKRGLRKGDVVLYMIKDLCKNNILMLGVWRANGVMRASYPDDDAETILLRVKESNIQFIVCEEDAVDLCKDVAEKAKTEIHIITTRTNQIGLLSLDQILEEDDGSACPQLMITETDSALILCTSGTTGFPKGAVHLHKSLLCQIRTMERLPFTLHKPNLLSSKATHISGSTIGLMTMACGKKTVVVSNSTPENIFKATVKYKPGLIFAFPTFLVAMAGPEGAGYDFSSVEVVLTGGSPITPAMRSTLFKLPGITDFVTAYGLTEMMSCTTSAVLKADDERDTPSIRDLPDFSVGKPYPGTELQVRDTETLQVLGPNQRGEICVKSDGLFHSYLNNPEATKQSYVDGYFRTGDVGYFDTNGFIYVVDRLKEIFKYYNNHISPTEIENVLAKHPKVLEACVCGVKDAGGHVPRAFITVRPDSGDKKEIADEIKQFAESKLASYKHLRGGVYIVEELPKGKTGKITRQLVEKLPVPC